VNPLLAVADEVRRRNPQAQVLVLGTTEGLEADLVPARGYELWPIPKVPLPRRPSTDFFKLPGRLKAAVQSAQAAINKIDAQVVVGFGGYVSTPAYFAAHRLDVPIVIHESNARPGLANRLGARWAAEVGFTFPDSRLTGGKVVGLPLRREIAALVGERAADPAGTRQRCAQEFGLDPARPILVVTGGSSGAVSINEAIVAAAPKLVEQGIQILHITGKGKVEQVQQVAAGMPDYHVLEYLTNMQTAFGCADLVVTRSGAGMVCELTALGIPAIYVPLPIGNGEQRLNAEPVVAAGGGILVDDREFTANLAADIIPALIADKSKLNAMAGKAAKSGVTDGAARIVDLIEAAVASKNPGSK
jgi:undecaprenyldiphospho-muramoylpentapeptide beta-N-acetylglucosaminyltransferase